jgi:hypothetical protein
MQHSTLSCSRLALILKLYVLIKYYGLILVVFTDCLGYCLRRKQQIGRLRVDAERQSLDNSLMLQRLAINLGYSVFVALAWVGLWHLNGFLFKAAEVSPLASLVFLPAILRPMAVLIFGVSGAVGLILGAAITQPLISTLSLPIVLITLSNGLVAWVVLLVLRQIPAYRSELTYDMSGLTLRTIILFAGLTALASSLTTSLIVFLSPDLSSTSGLPLYILAGDAIGAFLMLYLLSIFSPFVSKHFR